MPTKKPINGSVQVSVIMPCLNEQRTLAECVGRAREGLSAAGFSGEIIVVDNGSTDGSAVVGQSLGVQVVYEPARGYGNAVRRGFQEARGKYFIMGDADMSYDFGDIPRFVQKLEQGYDLVIGSRLKGRILPGAMPWKNRYFGVPFLTAVLNFLFTMRLSDAHCGLRGLSKSAFERMGLRAPGMEFASEMLVKAGLMRLRVAEIPITFWPDRRGRRPHLRPWRDGMRHLRFMLAVFLRQIVWG